MSDKPNCACLEIAYSPDDIEFTNPVTGAPIPGKREKWLCTQCGCEYSKTLWHNAVNKQQQDEIERLTALLEPLPPLIFHATTSIAIETAKEYLLEYAEEFMQEDPEIGMRCDPQNHEIFKWLSENLERIVPTKGGDT